MLIDSHCHLDLLEEKVDTLDAVIARAHEAGVKHMLTISTRAKEFARIEGIAKRYPSVFASVGVHPNEAEDGAHITTQDLLKVLEGPKVIGVGETGLDYYYENSPKEIQQVLFRRHIDAARIAKVPVIVHTRNAQDDTIKIMTQEYKKAPYLGLIHCFGGSIDFACKMLDLGFYISFSGIATFKNAEELRQVVAYVPKQRILVETDSPYLAPIPKRGKMNEPAFTRYVAQKIAEIKGVTFDDIERQTTKNFQTLFTKFKP